MAKKPRVQVSVSLTSASCTMVCSFETRCPLCGATVKPMETHRCGSSDESAAVAGLLRVVTDAFSARPTVSAGAAGRKRITR